MGLGRIAPDITAAWLTSSMGGIAEPQWAGLVSDDPFETSNPLSVEILGDAYRRPSCPRELVGTVLRNSTVLHWAFGPMTRIVGVAGFDAAFNGRVRWFIPFDGDPLNFPSGGSYDLPARSLFIGIDT
jgi:hypothetical protein